ncbi:hypothetical protein AX14_007435 [Amanita brunnescens Koide BX004]|nr:hypothetical protein AX14_007435 [Amanita brunnescens Koide BX004]
MTLTLACYFPAEKPIFLAINIEPDAWVDEVLHAIQRRFQLQRREVDLDDLRLFKTHLLLDPKENLQLRALQWLHQQPADGHLSVMMQLTDIFPTGPPLPRKQLDIIIADTKVLELVEGLGDPDDVYKRKVKRALDERLNRLPSTVSPSDMVHFSDKLADLLGGNDPLIHLGRPGGAPAVIFNPALANLQQRLDHLEELPVSRSEGKARRRGAMQGLVDEAIGQKGEWTLALDWADNIKPDGSWWYDGFLILVLELKNTLGLSGDALLQALVDYSKIVSRQKFMRFREFCNFPIVFIGATANRLEISVAGFMVPTTSSAWLVSLGPCHAVAQISKSTTIVSETWTFPNSLVYIPTQHHSILPKHCPNLPTNGFCPEVVSPPQLGDATTVIYTATLGDADEEVIVKFTARYSEVAHRLLAMAGLAPRLHSCDRVIGDLYMVVMERVDGKSVWQLRQEKMPLPAIISEEVSKAVGLLHENNIVFGDLRDPNILYDEPKNRVVLVDFDWPGQDGESRYPATLTLATLGKREFRHIVLCAKPMIYGKCNGWWLFVPTIFNCHIHAADELFILATADEMHLLSRARSAYQDFGVGLK